MSQPRPEIAAVLGGVLAEVELELIRREDARVLGKEAEEEAHKKLAELVPPIAAVPEGVVEASHELGRFKVCRILGVKLVVFVARDEGEVPNVAVEILQVELDAGRKTA